MTALRLQLFLIVTTRLSIANFSSCIPEEYRGVRREIWEGLNGGWFLEHLTTDRRFPKSPTSVEILRTLTPPRNDDNFYGQRLQAYFIPPVKGNYTFYATCDSECAFYLSLDERPGNKKELIRIDQKHRTGYDQWDRYPLQRSCLQQLEKGKLYYIEALHSNYINNDHVRIHIKYPGSNTSRSLDTKHLFLYSPGSSSQTTCVLLGRCDVTCGGGLETRITTREELLSGACVKQTEGTYKEAPSLLVEAYNVTTSTAVIAWRPLQRNESGVINVFGYRASVKSKQDKNHVKLVNASITSLLFEDLNIFTNYCVTVEPMTGLAGLEKDDCYHLRTDDDIPGLPPQNITAENKDPSSVLMKWKPVPEQYRNGIILGYRLTWKFMSAIDHQLEPNDEETEKWPRKATVLGPNVFLFRLHDVKAFTWYCLKMLAFTRKGDGPESSCIFILTQEGVPNQAPINVTTKPLNSTSFSVTWQQVPPDHVHGIVLGYKVLLENMADGALLFTETVNVKQTQITLNGSKEVSTFCVRVLAFTMKGDGKASSCTEAWTWSEETLFPDMKVTNHDSPSGISITWDAPRDQVIHQLTHYRVTYEIVSEAGQPVKNASMFSVNVSANSKQLSLDGLKTYTTYKIKVESVSLDGKVHNNKILLAETCRCPQLMLANWIPKPPYVIKDNSTSIPRGIIPELLAHMLQSSCGTCFSYKTWNITYTMNTTKSIIEPDIIAAVDFRFPVRSAIGKTKYKGSYTYVPLVTIPGVAVMTRKKTPMGYARDLGHSVFGCWPIFAISYVLAILTGVVMWFVEFKSNSEQFYHRFHKGVVEGIWWSFVTMATVGYGDRYPKTIVGRSIAIVWFLTGIVLSSLLVSSLTSSMSVRILDQHLNVARGKKVGSLAQFPEYDILIRYISKAGRSSIFPTLERLVDGLKQGEVDGILVDLYTAHYRSDLFNVSWITITRIVPYEFTTGVVINGNAAKLEQHFRDYVGNKGRVVTDILQKTNQENNKKVTTNRRIETEQMPLLDSSTPVFHTTVSILFSLLSLAVVIGLVYHSWYKRLQKRRYQLQEIRRRERREYTKTKLELQQMVEEFYQRFSLMYEQMRLKHRKQLERLKIKETKSLIDEMVNGQVPTHSLNGTWV